MRSWSALWLRWSLVPGSGRLRGPIATRFWPQRGTKSSWRLTGEPPEAARLLCAEAPWLLATGKTRRALISEAPRLLSEAAASAPARREAIAGRREPVALIAAGRVAVVGGAVGPETVAGAAPAGVTPGGVAAGPILAARGACGPPTAWLVAAGLAGP